MPPATAPSAEDVFAEIDGWAGSPGDQEQQSPEAAQFSAAPPAPAPPPIAFPPASTSAAGPGSSPAGAPPRTATSTLTSLLEPPRPGSPPYNLSAAQQALLPSYARLRKGIATVSTNRDVGNLGGYLMNCQIGYLNDHFKNHFVGGIKMLPSRNNRDDYVAFNFSNMKQLLRYVTVNNLAFTRSNFGYWVVDTPGQAVPLQRPFQLVLVGSSGERLTKTLANLQAQDLGLQFST
ncbi:hypothetical protein N2152v2_005218 [Parachlorella kessleri]